MNGCFYNCATAHMNVSSILNKGRIKRTERIALDVDVTAQVLSQTLCPACNFLPQSADSRALRQRALQKQLRNKLPVNKNNLGRCIFHAPVGNVRGGQNYFAR